MNINVSNRVKDLVAEQFGVDMSRVRPETNFIYDLEVDSLSVVELIMAVEEEFNIEIPEDEASTIATVGELISYVEQAIG